jgi:hypothetical protein
MIAKPFVHSEFGIIDDLITGIFDLIWFDNAVNKSESLVYQNEDLVH